MHAFSILFLNKFFVVFAAETATQANNAVHFGPATPSAVLDRTIESHGIRIVPGLTCRSPAGEPDVMRGEETQLLGLGMRILSFAALSAMTA